ncbi:Ger(x)C family spore germination protein [Ruminiclostridium cellobioparum]|uniref:Germination protein, Ger(X)C family n=1 Tax=Ruminiclostridium cellobioparum subsp. termitidis CT1112 TaxID=1195236 RepID=S0FFC6_RUMCE|nr:Ger(x)C family spore germination protein [Ruminiclostridium cellobioparum]EMS69535.1 germination protein, Ger(x)C family [Ruminiclostridium cellobioparum subsp. termitidis CT1112]
MIKRLLGSLLAITVLSIFCTGCWDYMEINQMSIVSGAAVDKTPDGKYKLSIEIIDLKGGGRDAPVHSKKLESYGDSIFDAIRNSIKISAQKLYWGHAEIIIISKDVAKEGILPIIDFLSRDAEPRLSIDILVSNEDTAEKLLDSQSISTEIRTYEINKMLDEQKKLSKSPKVEVYQFINALGNEGISAVIPVVGLTQNAGEATSQLIGTAVFKQDKLQYMFNGDDTKYYLFVMDKIKGGLLVVNKTQNNNNAGNFTLDIDSNKTYVKPVYSKGKLSFEISIKTKTTLGEIDDNKIKFTSQSEIEKLEKQTQAELKKNVERVIKAVQSEYDIDIFGFGLKVKQDMPELWKKIKPDWDDFFKNVQVEANAEVRIKHAGLLSNPIMMGD